MILNFVANPAVFHETQSYEILTTEDPAEAL